jgi:hypothetical protein
MSTIKILDLAVSGLDPHTKYKFAFENKGGNWPIRVSPLSGVFYPERVKTYVYFCANSGECLSSDPNVFFNLPSNNPSVPGLSLEEKSLYSVLDLVIKDFDTSEVVYTHPCIVECDECADRLSIFTTDLHLTTASNNFAQYSITFSNLIPNQSYSYNLDGIGGNWPIKVSPVSGTITPHSNSYTAKGIVSFCPYSGACVSNDTSVLNYSLDFDNNRQYSQDPYSVVKVTLAPTDDYLQKGVTDTFIVTCDECIPQLNIVVENNVVFIDDVNVGATLNVAFNNLVPGERYQYIFNGKDGNWPLIVSSHSGALYASSSSAIIPFAVNFCSTTGICPDTIAGVMSYDTDQNNPVNINNIHKQSQFNISVYQDGRSEPVAISNDVLVKCNDCIQNANALLDPVVILEDVNTGTTNATLNNLIVGETYNYHFESVNNNWPLNIYPVSGSIVATNSTVDIATKIVYCESSGACPSGMLNVLDYTFDNNSVLSPNTNVKLIVNPVNSLLSSFRSNTMNVQCVNCLAPKTIAQLPAQIVLDGPQIEATDVELTFDNLLVGETYNYYYRGVNNNWPAALYPISGTIVASDTTVTITSKLKICASTGLCPSTNTTVLSYNYANSSPLNKNINFVADIVPQKSYLDSFSSNHCSVYCNNCIAKPLISLSSDTVLTDTDTHNLSINIENISPDYQYSYRLLSTNANWPVVIYPISGTIEGVSNKAFDAKLSFCASTGICASSNNVLDYQVGSVCDKYFNPLNKFAQIKLELQTNNTEPPIYSDETIIGCDGCIHSISVSLDREYLDLQNTNIVTVTGYINNLVPNKTYFYEVEGLEGTWPVMVYPLSGTIYSSGNNIAMPIKLSFCPSTGVCPQNADLPVLPYTVDNNCFTDFGGSVKYSMFRLKVSDSECDSETVYSNTTRLSCSDCLPKPTVRYKDNANLVNTLEKSITSNNPYELHTMFSGLVVGQNYDYVVNYVDSNWPVVVTPQSGSFIAKNLTKSIKTNVAFCYPTGECVSNNTDAILSYSSNSIYDNSDKKFITINFDLTSSDCSMPTVYGEDFNLICDNCFPQSSYSVSISGGPIMTLPISCCSGTRLITTNISGAVPKIQHAYYFEPLSPNVSIQSPSSGYVTFKDSGSYNVFAISNINLSEYDEGLIRFRLINTSDSVENIDYLAIKCGNAECPT